jgi:predicted membrane channel-forming protein YqfA (hemolysin III family)
LMTEYYSYYCRPTAKLAYMLFTALVGSTGVILPMFPFWDTKAFRPVRIGVFLLMAFSSAVPVVHITFLNGAANTWEFMKPVWYSVAMYILGVAICKFGAQPNVRYDLIPMTNSCASFFK